MLIIAGTVRINADRLEDHKRLMQWWVPDSRAARGCVFFTSSYDPDDPTIVHLAEGWESDEALAARAHSEGYARLSVEMQGVRASTDLTRYDVASSSQWGVPA